MTQHTRLERCCSGRALLAMAAMASLVVLTAGDIKIGAQPRLDSQRQSSTPTFRRVSITVNESGGERGFCCRLEPGGRVIATNATLRQLIQAAYVRHGFDRREVEGGPAWVESTRFDLVGRRGRACIRSGRRSPSDVGNAAGGVSRSVQGQAAYREPPRGGIPVGAGEDGPYRAAPPAVRRRLRCRYGNGTQRTTSREAGLRRRVISWPPGRHCADTANSWHSAIPNCRSTRH